MRLDLREKQAWFRIDTLLAKHRPGKTPLRLDLLLRSPAGGVAGMLDLNGSHSVRIDQQLMDSLRADPAVRTLKVKYSPPWAQ